MRFSPILCAIDGSEHAERALEAAAALARQLGAELVLVHAIHLPPELEGLSRHYATGGDYEQRAIEVLRAESEALLDQAAAPLRAAGLSVATVTAVGPAGPAIVDVADDRDAAWVVVGTHGRTGLGRLLLGSVATWVVHHAKRPVTVVPRAPFVGGS